MASRVLAQFGPGPTRTPSKLRSVPAETTAAKAKDPAWKAPRTSWGHPDLSGIWTSDDMRGIPTTRPAAQKDRESLTPEEFARRAGGDEASRDRAVNQETVLRNEFGVRTFGYTSFLVDPPDGQLPPLTPAGLAKQRESFGVGTFGNRPFNGFEDFSLYDRCITRGVEDQDYAVGSGGSTPHWVASGDLNNDGFDDVAVADVGSSQFSILLGNGTGALLPRTDFALASAPYTIALADMNADGLADVVTVLGNNMVSVNAGNGSGGFGSAATFATPVGPVHAEVGDLNGDGRPDIATANQYSNSISVLFGNGTGGFRARSDITSLAGPYNVAMADANGDGRLDLATPNLLGNSASVLLNSGTGGFGPKLDVGVGAEPHGHHAG